MPGNPNNNGGSMFGGSGTKWDASFMVGETREKAEQRVTEEKLKVAETRFSDDAKWIASREFYEDVKRYIADQPEEQFYKDPSDPTGEWDYVDHNDRGVLMQYRINQQGKIAIKIETSKQGEYIYVNLEDDSDEGEVRCDLALSRQEGNQMKTKFSIQVGESGAITNSDAYITTDASGKKSVSEMEAFIENQKRIQKAIRFMRTGVSEYVDYLNDQETETEQATRRTKEMLKSFDKYNRENIQRLQTDIADIPIDAFVARVDHALNTRAPTNTTTIAPISEVEFSENNRTYEIKKVSKPGQPAEYTITTEDQATKNRMRLSYKEGDPAINHVTAEFLLGTKKRLRPKTVTYSRVFVTNGPDEDEMYFAVNGFNRDQREGLLSQMEQALIAIKDDTEIPSP
jgi:hypothetical protein